MDAGIALRYLVRMKIDATTRSETMTNKTTRWTATIYVTTEDGSRHRFGAAVSMPDGCPIIDAVDALEEIGYAKAEKAGIVNIEEISTEGSEVEA